MLENFRIFYIKHGTDLFPLASFDNNPVTDPVALHWHKEFEAGIVTEGSIQVETPNRKIELKAGNGFFFGSEVLHSIMPGSITPCRLHSLIFKHSIISGSNDSVFYRKYTQPVLMNSAYSFVHLESDKHAVALEQIEKAWQLHQAKQSGYEIRIRNELSELLFFLQNMSLCENEMTGYEKKEVYRLKQMLSYIELHYQENITLPMIANSANISESEVLRGFQDISYFTKVFRENKGMPPAKFRKSQL